VPNKFAILPLAVAACLAADSPKPKKTPLDEAHTRSEPSQRKALSDLTREFGSKVARAPVASVKRKNYIDDHIFGKMEREGVPHAGLATDAEFLRRVHLDLTGLIPEADAARKFLADTDPDKRDKVVDSILAITPDEIAYKRATPFIDKWVWFFGDLFRSTHEFPGNAAFSHYLNDVLLKNVPYDAVARELITAEGRSSVSNALLHFLVRDAVFQQGGVGVLGGINSQTINHEDTADNNSINVTRVFLGINLECISCHAGAGHLENSNIYLTGKSREDFWRHTAFFAQSPVKLPFHQQSEFSVLDEGGVYDVTTESKQRIQRHKADLTPTFLLTGERLRPGEKPRAGLARMLTSHAQFARTTVNMIWAELMGVGIVDPPFDFDLARMDPKNPPPSPWSVQPTHPELLDKLAEDFRAHHYDLKHLMRTICTSSAYQLSARFPGEWKDDYSRYFARRMVRRLSGLQLWDAITRATGKYDDLEMQETGKKVKLAVQARGIGRLPKELQSVLLTFGVSFRRHMSVGEPLRSSMDQIAVLLNGELVKKKIAVGDKGRLQDLLNHNPPLTNEQIAEELTLATLSRFPDAREKELAGELLANYRHQGAEDLMWALINKMDFVLNY